jgi:holliday junction DNA helicase RuvB
MHHHHHHHRLRAYSSAQRTPSVEELFPAPPRRLFAPPEGYADGAGDQLKPLDFDARSGNALRPATFDQMVGQDRLRRLLARIVAHSKASGSPLPHLMLAGASGTGKTTLGQVLAHESGRRVFQVKAPVGLQTLDKLRLATRDGDVVIIDEIHQQVVGDRRGMTQAADPEDFYHIMEDRRLPTSTGMLEFPAVTFIGCTTDEGLLPEAFLNRFPLRLSLDRYTVEQMGQLALANAAQLKVGITAEAAALFAGASRRNPRQLNTYIRNAVALGTTSISLLDAKEVIVDLNGCTLDGLTVDMQGMLKCLLRSRRNYRDGRVLYQASVNTIATALGHSRDTKAVSLFVEPYLIEEGLVGVQHGGRTLTDAGLARAKELS